MARRSLYVFTAEMALKIVAQGFVLNRGAYLRDVWNWLDFTVVVSGWVASVLARELSGDSNDLSAISALRAIRVLRPLRTINRVPGMKVLVRSLLGAIPAMASVLLLCGFIFLVFGIIGVQLFAGALHDRCHDELVVGLSVHARACLREQPAADDCTAAVELGLPQTGEHSVLGNTRVFGARVRWLSDGSGVPPPALLLALSADNATWSSHALLPTVTAADGCAAAAGTQYTAADIGGGNGVLARWARVTVNATCGAGSASLDIQGVDIVTAGHAPADGTDVCCDPARGCTGRACPAGHGETVFWVPALYDPSWQPQQGGYVALLYDPTTSGKVNQRHVINNPQAVLMLLRKQINARRLAVLKARAPAIDRGGRGDDELAA